ncbi:hypothetical protein SLA2020_098270 [Shorea laevis]
MVANCRMHAISCTETISTLLPYKLFLTGGSPSPSVPCYIGLRKLNDKASITNKDGGDDHCHHLKNVASGIRVIVDRAKQLPQLCAVSVRVPIDPNDHCDS